MAATIALSEAKSGLSGLVRKVHDTRAEYVLTVNGKPMATLSPLPKKAPTNLRGFGLLAHAASDAARALEDEGWELAMKEKYGDAARH